MRLRDFFSSLVPGVLLRKTHMLIFVLLFGSLISARPSDSLLLMFPVFLLTYSSVYFHNDLLDLEKDREDLKAVTREKLLARGVFQVRDYVNFLAFSLCLGLLAAFVIDKGFAILLAALLLVCFLRSNVKNLTVREFLLAAVEFGNFEVLWYAAYKTLIPAFLVPPFAAYAFLYSVAHSFYKKAGLATKLLLSLPAILFSFLVLYVLSTAPLLILGLVLMCLSYGIPVILAKEKGIDKLWKNHAVGLALSAAIAAIVSLLGVSVPPTQIMLPPEVQLLDTLQTRILALMT